MSDRAIWPASMGALTRFEPQSWRVNATQEVSYEVRQVDGIFTPNSLQLITCGKAKPCSRQVIVIDAHVDQIYGDEMRAYYAHHRADVSILSLSVSEESKDLDSALMIARHIETAGVLRRSEPVVAIGGGYCWTWLDLLLACIGGAFLTSRFLPTRWRCGMPQSASRPP